MERTLGNATFAGYWRHSAVSLSPYTCLFGGSLGKRLLMSLNGAQKPTCVLPSIGRSRQYILVRTGFRIGGMPLRQATVPDTSPESGRKRIPVPPAQTESSDGLDKEALPVREATPRLRSLQSLRLGLSRVVYQLSGLLSGPPASQN